MTGCGVPGPHVTDRTLWNKHKVLDQLCTRMTGCATSGPHVTVRDEVVEDWARFSHWRRLPHTFWTRAKVSGPQRRVLWSSPAELFMGRARKSLDPKACSIWRYCLFFLLSVHGNVYQLTKQKCLAMNGVKLIWKLIDWRNLLLLGSLEDMFGFWTPLRVWIFL
jgi:hypothetical protein